MTQLVSLILIRWIVIYPMDSAIQRLNNRGHTCFDGSSVILSVTYCEMSVEFKKRAILQSSLHWVGNIAY